MKKSLRTGAALLALSLIGLYTPQVQAGPGVQIFYPVRTVKAADALKTGAKIAVQCGNCGAFTITTVGNDRSVLNAFTCPACKREFRVKRVGSSGKTHATGTFVYVDGQGHTATLTAAR
jgi:predicted RNA-binding Zn-ribbon protein involved in translation (DUF1610 family)